MNAQDYSNRLALNRVEAAAFLGLSPATIDRLAKRRMLRASRATRRPLYAISELERFLSESTDALSASFPDGKSIVGTSRREEVKNHGKSN